MVAETGNKRRITFFVSAMEDGGAERVAALLCNYWSQNGHAVNLVVTYSKRGQCNYTLNERVQVIYLADQVRGRSSGLMSKMIRLRACRKLVQSTESDLVVSFLAPLNIAILIATLGLDVPVVVSERVFPEFSLKSRFASFARRLLYPLAKTVVVQSSEGEEWLRKHCPGSHVDVIHNPLVHPLPITQPIVLPNKFIAEDKRVILGVGRLVPKKGFERLISGFAQFSRGNPKWILALVGQGPEKASLMALAKRLDLEENVVFPGRIGNLSDWYKRAEVFVLSSYREGFPNVLLEAMSYGVASIAADCPSGPADIIQPDVNGLLVSNKHFAEDLVSGLDKLAGNSILRKAIGDQAVKIQETCSMESIGLEWDRATGIA